MAIKTSRQAPAAGKATVLEALHELDPGRDAVGRGRVDISEPLPIFRLGLDDLTEPDVLDRAGFVAWRYLVAGRGAGTAMAEVGEHRGGSPFLASLARNEQAEFLLQAAHVAQSEADAASQDCEIRILLVPGLSASALWLTTDPPVFIPFLDVTRPVRTTSDVKVQPDFLPRLVARAKEQRAAPNSAPRPLASP